MSWKIHTVCIAVSPVWKHDERQWLKLTLKFKPIWFAWSFLCSAFLVRTHARTHAHIRAKRMVKCIINFPTALNIWISNFISGSWKRVLLFKLDFSSSLLLFATWCVCVCVCMLEHVFSFSFAGYMTNAMLIILHVPL